MIAIIFFCLAVPVLFGVLYKVQHGGDKALAATPKPEALNSSGLSPVAAQVYREYMSLPVDSRPFGNNIRDILKSLDATLGGLAGFKDHFDDNFHMRARGYTGWDNHKFSWHAAILPVSGYTYHEKCSHRSCDFKPYYDLHIGIKSVKDAIDEKARALVLSENAPNVAMADELVKALRAESQIHRDATARLKEIG